MKNLWQVTAACLCLFGCVSEETSRDEDMALSSDADHLLGDASPADARSLRDVRSHSDLEQLDSASPQVEDAGDLDSSDDASPPAEDLGLDVGGPVFPFDATSTRPEDLGVDALDAIILEDSGAFDSAVHNDSTVSDTNFIDSNLIDSSLIDTSVEHDAFLNVDMSSDVQEIDVIVVEDVLDADSLQDADLIDARSIDMLIINDVLETDASRDADLIDAMPVDMLIIDDIWAIDSSRDADIADVLINIDAFENDGALDAALETDAFVREGCGEQVGLGECPISFECYMEQIDSFDDYDDYRYSPHMCPQNISDTCMPPTTDSVEETLNLNIRTCPTGVGSRGFPEPIASFGYFGFEFDCELTPLEIPPYAPSDGDTIITSDEMGRPTVVHRPSFTEGQTDLIRFEYEDPRDPNLPSLRIVESTLERPSSRSTLENRFVGDHLRSTLRASTVDNETNRREYRCVLNENGQLSESSMYDSLDGGFFVRSYRHTIEYDQLDRPSTVIHAAGGAQDDYKYEAQVSYLGDSSLISMIRIILTNERGIPRILGHHHVINHFDQSGASPELIAQDRMSFDDIEGPHIAVCRYLACE